MSFRSWLLAAAAGAMLGLMQSAVAQQAAQPEVAKLPDAQEIAEPDSGGAARRGSAGRASEEAATGASEALVENGWDFNKPDTIYGFGSLPANEAKPLAHK